MSASAPNTAPLQLWLTSRSAYEAGVIHCPRDRYLAYHAGPHGYGWRRKAQSLPTVTGTLVHDPIATVLAEVKRTDQIPSDAWIYQYAIVPAQRAYAQVVESRGLQHIVDPDELALRTIEQSTLIEGLVWAWAWTMLPSYHEQYRVVLVEEELPVVIGCTCGLGDRVGTLADHDGRGCTGIGWQTRGDAIAQHRITGGYRYDEVKTTSNGNPHWQAAWQYRAQVLAGVLGAEQQLGVTIDEVWIHGLVKGSLKASWDPVEKRNVGEKYQQSVLCYGYRRPANLPLYDEAWGAEYDLPPDPITGKGKRLGKDYKRTGIWELPADQWSTAGALSPSHYWCQWIGKDLLAKAYLAVGPIYRENWRLESVLTQIVGEERRVQAGVWAVYDAIVAAGGDWTAPSVQTVLDRHFPMAGGDACHSFFGTTCPNLVLCKRQDGWEAPERIGFVPRRPHHTDELQQAIDRGCVLPEVGVDDEGEE